MAKTALPVELMPAYERPVDKDSIDARMKAQLAFEDAHPQRSNRERRRGDGNFIRKSLAIGASVLALMGIVELTGRAIDQNENQYNHNIPTATHSGDRHR